MRIRCFYYQRRIMCLIMIFVWSLSTMMILWKKIKQNDRYRTIRDAIIRLSDELDMSGSSKLELEKKRDILEVDLSFMGNKDRYSGDFFDFIDYKDLKQVEPTMKLRKIVKPKVDYGHGRDLDVEGVHDYVLWYENFHDNVPQLPTLPRQQKCKKPVQNIAFVKTHHTGSDVLTNILNRYGDLNYLNVALPSDGLPTFYWPMRFQWKYIDITLLNGSLPNIISNHARYNNDVMDNILNPGSVYITILRDPVTQLETTFNNLGFGGLLQVTNTTDQLSTFLENPKYYIRGVIRRKRFKDTLNLIKNAQFFDLGLSTTEYHRKNVIKMTTQELYEKFSIVLIYEYLDESLVLMKRRLCWQLDDILYLKFHYANHDKWNRKTIPAELADKIRKWNEADVYLYEFFNKTLWKEIGYEGEVFWKELAEFKTNQKSIEEECIINESSPPDETFSLLNIPTKSEKARNSHTSNIKLSYNNVQYEKDKKSGLINRNNLADASTDVMYIEKKHRSGKYQYWKLRDILVHSKAIKNVSSTDSYREDNSHENLLEIPNLQQDMETFEEEESYVRDENNNLAPSPPEVNKQINTDPLGILRNLEDDLYSENEQADGSGDEEVKKKEVTTVDRMLSRSASSWNSYLCKKLLMTELEYLDYFRKKHAHAKRRK